MDKQQAKKSSQQLARPEGIAEKTDKKSNNDINDKKLNTETLDDVMNEFIQICNQYNQKLSLRSDSLNASSSLTNNKTSKDDSISISSDCSSISNSKLNNKCDMTDNRKLPSAANIMASKSNEHGSSSSSAVANLGSIDSLQAKQCEVQAQLDQVLESLQILKKKQTQKLESIYEDGESSNERNSKHSISSNDQLLSDDDDELLEFQQIENELRVSELTRQLDLIQEKIRLKLYKRLISHSQSVGQAAGETSVGVIKQQRLHTLSSGRRGSHSDESSPSSSSFSDEVPSSTSPAHELPNESSKTATQVNGYNKIPDDSKHQQQQAPCQTLAKQEQVQRSKNYNMMDTNTNPTGPINKDDIFAPTSTGTNRENINPYPGHDSVDSESDRNLSYSTQDLNSNIESDNQSNSGQPHESMPAQYAFANCSPQIVSNCNSLAFQGHIGMYDTVSSNIYARITDLGRIDEDELEEEEEDVDDVSNYVNEEDKLESHYHSPKQLRSIYQETISPLLHASQDTTNGHKNILTDPIHQHKALNEIGLGLSPRDRSSNSAYLDGTQTTNGDQRGSFNYEDSLIAKSLASKNNITNRPLTLYLPKPDEEINLMDHIQRIGHDLELISNDIKLNHSSAKGYLWKCCSNNNKKWLKRYFYFDRKSKVFAYYDNEFELVKKNKSNTDYCLPEKRCIPFEDINDVYVEHRLSLGSSGKGGDKKRSTNKASTGGRYVFVLSTVGRRFMLATRNPESLRAWVDILFTAAKTSGFDLDQFVDQQPADMQPESDDFAAHSRA